jgi:hypothetical protein
MEKEAAGEFGIRLIFVPSHHAYIGNEQVLSELSLMLATAHQFRFWKFFKFYFPFTHVGTAKVKAQPRRLSMSAGEPC